MSFNRHLFSSLSGEWETPQDLYDTLNEEFHFTLDPCATAETAKCESYFTEEDDGLSKPWTGNVFVNPPYGKGIINWVSKCYNESRLSANVVVSLLPSRTDTRWWHEYVMQADDIRFIKGGLKFNNSVNSAPFPSVIVIWKNKSSMIDWEKELEKIYVEEMRKHILLPELSCASTG